MQTLPAGTIGFVRRSDSGVIDIPYYERRIRRLRTRWLHMVIRRMIGRMVACVRRSALSNELRSLDDRALRDMGISRDDIPAIVSGAFARDDTRRRGAGISLGKQKNGARIPESIDEKSGRSLATGPAIDMGEQRFAAGVGVGRRHVVGIAGQHEQS